MKLPKEIKSAIRKAGKHDRIAKENNNLTREWLEQNMPEEQSLWEDALIDSLELGIDGSESFIKFIESGCRFFEEQ